MKDLDIKSLRLLVAVCDSGNIRQAAQQAHIEPSAISKRMAQLEGTLGTPLLHRGRRGVRPTPAGQALLEHARALLFTMQKIESDVADFAVGVRGHVRLVATASAIADALLDDVADFLREPAHRDIRIDMEERLSIDVVRLVQQGSVSLGVAWDQIDMGGLQTAPYREDELVLAVPTGHPLARRRSLRFEQSLDHEQVTLMPGTAVTTMLHRASARAGRSLRCRIVVSNFDAALRVVAAGLAISVLPRTVSTLRAERGDITVVSLTDSWAFRRFALCFRDRGGLSPAAQRMLAHLSSQAQIRPDRSID